MLWESVPLVAVTLTLNVPVAALADVTFRVELPAPFEVSVIVEGLRLVVGPVGETEAAMVTVPVNELRLVTVIVDFPEDPWRMLNEVGLAERPKSGAGVTCYVTLVWEDRAPLVSNTIARLLAAAEPVQDSVEEPEPPLIVVADSEQDSPVEFVVIDRVTVPVNPFWGLTIIVEVPATPEFAVTLVGLAVTENVGAFVT